MSKVEMLFPHKRGHVIMVFVVVRRLLMVNSVFHPLSDLSSSYTSIVYLLSHSPFPIAIKLRLLDAIGQNLVTSRESNLHSTYLIGLELKTRSRNGRDISKGFQTFCRPLEEFAMPDKNLFAI